jgi:hypothetical protein
VLKIQKADPMWQCIPGKRRCYSDTPSSIIPILECNSTGTGWAWKSTCYKGCFDGVCVATNSIAYCNPGDRECYPNDSSITPVLECNSTGTGWAWKSTCYNGCFDGTCLPKI